MGIFPVTQITEIEPITTQTNDRGTEFLFDFSTKDFLLKNGKLVELAGDAAVQFWIEKTLRTEYERARVYKNTNYGTEIEKYIGKAVNPVPVAVQMEENIKNALLQHERIGIISNFKLTKIAEKVTIEFEVDILPLKRKPVEGAVLSLENIVTTSQFNLVDANRFYFKTVLNEQVVVGGV